jgi:uncharacterized protein (TIGR00661 family)
MKILYGVQGTGNGHISRASAMAEAFQAWPELDVTWLLSGRERQLGCGGITTFEWRRGLTFVCRNGRIQVLDTLRGNNLVTFLRDVAALDLRPYDLVICDYEPVIAHAARKRGVPVTGIGHQYAFSHAVPLRGANPLVKAIMRGFAPVTTGVGLHWHHFGFPILPPIIDIHIPERLPPARPEKVIVYLPFENPQQVLQMLGPCNAHEFYVYHPDLTDRDEGHLHPRAISRQGFKQDLLDTGSVITNSGFELISECLQLGKRILTKPLQGQMEQLSNAAALDQLGYARVLDSLDTQAIAAWLKEATPGVQISYPDVPAALAAWLAGGSREPVADLADSLWKQTAPR